MSRQRKRILVVRLDRIGDVLLSTPVIKNLRDAYPKSYIAFMVRPYAREITQGNPYLDDVIVYDKENEESGLAANFEFIKYLRRKKFDTAVILHPTTRTNLLIFLTGIRERIGYDRKWGFLLTHRIPHTKQEGLKHEIDYTLDVLKHMGLTPQSRQMHMPINSVSEMKVGKALEAAGICDDDLLIAINPSASCPSKRWPAVKFAKVADTLKNKYNAKIVIIGAKGDLAFGDAVHRSMGGESLDLSGKTTVSELASVLKRAKLFISNDSGPVHIACALGTPVVAIFGRSDQGLSPKRWGPSGKRDIVLHKNAGCVVCLAHNCVKDFLCLDAITVEDVVSAAAKILGK